MAYTKTKDLKNQIDEAINGGVTNKKTLANCLKKALECQARIKSMREVIKDLSFRVEEVYKKSVKYVRDHFDETVERDGIYRTDIDLGEDGKFVMKRSKDKIERIDASSLTQGFLKGLPAAWTRSKLELSTTAINNLGVSDKDLTKNELVRKDKFTFDEVNESSEEVE